MTDLEERLLAGHFADINPRQPTLAHIIIRQDPIKNEDFNPVANIITPLAPYFSLILTELHR
jgi:hypothetical protein